MLIITEKTCGSSAPDTVLTLPFEKRQKARQRVVLEDGREAGLQLERGKILRDGDKLKARDGTVVLIKAAEEKVSTVKTDDRKLLARVSWTQTASAD